MHHIAQNGLLIFINVHNIHNGKWCNLFCWTQKLHQLRYIIKHTKCSHWLSCSEGEKKKRVKNLCIGCQGHGNLSNRMRTISSRMRLLSLGYRYSKRPSRLFLHVSITFDMQQRVWLQKALLCTTLNHEASAFCIVVFDCHGAEVSKLAGIIMVILLVVYGPYSDPHVC